MHCFPDDLTCLKHLEKRRWSDGNIVCPHCGHQGKIYRFKDGKRSNAVLAVNDSMLKLELYMKIVTFHCKNGILPTICLHLPKKGISSVELAKILTYYTGFKLVYVTSDSRNFKKKSD